MKFNNESAFTRWFCRQLEAASAETIPMVGSTMGKNGLPDRYVCHTRFRGWLEFKRDNGRLTTLQRLQMEKLSARGDTCLVVRIKNTSILIEDANGSTLQTLDFAVLPKDSRGCGNTLLEELKRAVVQLQGL